MNHSYKKIIVPALLGTLFLGACSDDASFEGEGKQQTYSLVVKGITTSGSDSSEELRDVSVFQFSDGNLYKNCTIIQILTLWLQFLNWKVLPKHAAIRKLTLA